MPVFQPTAEEMSWAEANILPIAYNSAENLFKRQVAKFDKTNIDQSVFNGWTVADKVRAHFDEMQLKFRRFSVFVGAAGATASVPHIDGGGMGFPAVARLNVPLRGIEGSRLSFWDETVGDPRIQERHFEEWDAATQSMKRGFSYLSVYPAEWGEPKYTVINPGPCWNHVEVAHKLELDNTTEIRINITAELEEQVPWTTIIQRLQALGYC
jgi:hypothetical protein